VVESLIVHEVPAGASVEVACQGKGCPSVRSYAAKNSHHRSCHKHSCKPKHRASSKSEVDLTALFKNRRLHVGTHISVNVLKPGWVGTTFLFTTRANRTAREQTNCLAAGSTKPGQGC
jgi:hypothetical protein